jgi:hypothetical protein
MDDKFAKFKIAKTKIQPSTCPNLKDHNVNVDNDMAHIQSYKNPPCRLLGLT